MDRHTFKKMKKKKKEDKELRKLGDKLHGERKNSGNDFTWFPYFQTTNLINKPDLLTKKKKKKKKLPVYFLYIFLKLHF